MKRIIRASTAVPFLAMLLTPFLPFVNKPALWIGLPSVVVWIGIWALLVTAVLAWNEFGTEHPEDAEDDPCP